MRVENKLRIDFNAALVFILIISFFLIANQNPAFLSGEYIISVVLKNAIEIGFLALPMTIIIVTGGIDLSCGNMMVLASMLGGIAAAKGGSLLGIAVTFLVGCACGLLNGVIIAKIKVPAMVTTLATMYLFLGIARGISKGVSIYSYPVTDFLGNALVFGIPIQVYIYIIWAVIFVTILQKSVYGRIIFAIGRNEGAARYSGVNTEIAVIKAYVLEGVMAGFAALTWIGRFTSLKYDAGTNLHMKVITVVVLGGTSILGGYGDMKGTIIATLIIAVLNSGLTVMGMPVDAQTIVQGTVLLISLTVYALINMQGKRKKRPKLQESGGEKMQPLH